MAKRLDERYAGAVRERLLELIACPRCAGAPFSLEVRQGEEDEILEGSLDCPSCKTRYEVRRGVPRLMPDAGDVPNDAQRTVDRFGKEWNDFDFLSHHYEAQFLAWIHPIKPADFKDKIVLEGGCGKGRHSALAAAFGAKDVIAVDLSSAVDAAYRNTHNMPNVHVVQADLFHLPVPRASVDLAFSVGVLHHTHDPRGSFQELVARVKPGGRVVAWVYGYENNEWIVRYVDPVRRGVTSRLPHKVIFQASKLPAAVLWAAARGVYRPLSKGALSGLGDKLFYRTYVNAVADFPFNEIHSIVHDHLTPPLAQYLRREEFEDWFSALGLRNVEISWHNENSWRGTAVVPGPSA